MQLDPLTDDYPFLTPYQYASNDPITNIDIDGLEGGPAVGGIAGAAAGAVGVAAEKTLETVFVKAGPRVASAGAAKGIKLSSGIKVATAIKAANLINNIATKREVSESTGQNAGIRPHTLQAPKERPTISSPSAAQNSWSEKHGIEGNYETFVLKTMRNENIEKVENAFGSDWPLVGNFLKAGRYEIQYGYHAKAFGAAKDLGVEVATYYIAGKVIGAGLKFVAPAAKTGSNIALGVREHLGDFAKSVNGSTWKTWGATNFESGFMNTINNSANKIHFNLTGINNPWSAISQGAKGFQTGGYTNWELFQLYSNPGALQRTTFYLNGKVVPSPF
jgi:hypothetical protein